MHLRTSRNKMFSLAAATTLAAMAFTGCASAEPEAPPTGNTSSEVPAPTPNQAPAATASPSPAPELKTHDIANGHFKLTTPADWTLKQKKADRSQTHSDVATSLDILAANGSLMATLRLGEDAVMDENPPIGGLKYTQLDRAKPALGQGNSFAFEALGAEGQEAVMGIGSFDNSRMKSMEELNPTVGYENGSGSFTRRIIEDDRLKDVPADLKGMDRLKAFAATEEYEQIKSMMISFKQTKASTSTADVPRASGECTGANYTYELKDSGLTCTEAKSFVQKFAGLKEEFGSITVPGLGMCTPPTPGTEGWCEVGESGKFLFYQLK